jgi:hypothetical protein
VTFGLIVAVLEALCAAHGDGKLVDNVPASQEPQVLSYETFLEEIGLAERKQDLADFLSKPGDELQELIQMDDDDLNDDILTDGDLAFDEETQGKFRAAVAALKSGASADSGIGDRRATADGSSDALADWVAANVNEKAARSVRAAETSASAQDLQEELHVLREQLDALTQVHASTATAL